MNFSEKLSLKEKVGYALGDGAANIAWRGVAIFLAIFYTDVFGLHPAAVALLLLVARATDGITDVLMGLLCDRTSQSMESSDHGCCGQLSLLQFLFLCCLLPLIWVPRERSFMHMQPICCLSLSIQPTMYHTEP